MTNDPQGKIEVTIGRVTFSGEGTQDWLAEQLDKVLETANSHPTSLDEAEQESVTVGPEATGNSGAQNVSSLASYLKTKNASSSQVKRFLSTAGWLAKKGNNALKTADVTKALRDNHQTRIGNPADTLNNNVSKGFCEKTSDGFFITPEGWAELGDSI
ncbi:hypothetical protein MHM39_16370 [Phaeobacter sp. CNT1-3]|nr:hypothetical protein [Phaeobacter sp. CNT1-3]